MMMYWLNMPVLFLSLEYIVEEEVICGVEQTQQTCHMVMMDAGAFLLLCVDATTWKMSKPRDCCSLLQSLNTRDK